MGVYCIQNSFNDKCYVGSSTDLRGRLRSHKSQLRNNRRPPEKLAADWAIFKPDVFLFIILEEVSDVSLLIEREQYWLDAKDAFLTGYNSDPIAGSRSGAKRHRSIVEKAVASATGKKKTPEHIEKMRIASTGRPKTAEEIEKLRAAGKRNGMAHITAEHRALAAKNKIGWEHSPETRQQMSESRRGKTHSDQARQNMSAAQKGRIVSDAARANMSKAHIGKTHSAEVAAKISAANKGKKKPPRTAEHAEKIAAALKAKYAAKYPEKARALAAGIHPSTVAYQWKTDPEAFKLKWSE
jgi:group I intron endonuclease